MIYTLSKINLSKIGQEGGRSTSIWVMSLNILGFFGDYPLVSVGGTCWLQWYANMSNKTAVEVVVALCLGWGQ